jgi:inosine-uridine nucleoside N-ribohydrolase
MDGAARQRPACLGPEADHNVQFDTRAAQILVAAATDLTLVTLPVTLKAHLRAADLPRLRASILTGRASRTLGWRLSRRPSKAHRSQWGREESTRPTHS